MATLQMRDIKWHSKLSSLSDQLELGHPHLWLSFTRTTDLLPP